MSEKEDSFLMDLMHFIKEYPRLYSEKKMDEWRSLFHSNAVMIRLQEGTKPRIQSIHDALPEQIEYAEENEIFIETWQNPQISIFGNTATVNVHYILETDHEVRSGIDLVTLTRSPRDHNWKIICLTYEEQSFTRR